MTLVPAHKYVYAHGKHPRILKDLDELEFDDINEFMLPTRAVWDDANGNLYVNTWIGRDGKYVLPGIGCVVEKLHEMHNDMLRTIGLKLTKDDPLEYIPDIFYPIYSIHGVDRFVERHPERKFLFSNGFCQSSQAANFDMNPMIHNLAIEYGDYCFIVTQDFPNKPENVFSTGEMIGTGLGNDLNEISYLSTFCEIIVGRNSGPHVFAQVKKNWMDKDKTLISFTHLVTGSSFVLSDKLPMMKRWTCAVDYFNTYRIVKETIDD